MCEKHSACTYNLFCYSITEFVEKPIIVCVKNWIVFKYPIRVNKRSDWFCVCLSNFNVMFASPIIPCALTVFLSLVSLASRILGNPRQFWILDSTLWT